MNRKLQNMKNQWSFMMFIENKKKKRKIKKEKKKEKNMIKIHKIKNIWQNIIQDDNLEVCNSIYVLKILNFF